MISPYAPNYPAWGCLNRALSAICRQFVQSAARLAAKALFRDCRRQHARRRRRERTRALLVVEELVDPGLDRGLNVVRPAIAQVVVLKLGLDHGDAGPGADL